VLLVLTLGWLDPTSTKQSSATVSNTSASLPGALIAGVMGMNFK
jgi:hypothetical protein